MKCQHCEHKEAEYHFKVNWLGMDYNIHLCGECREKLTNHYMNMIDRRHGGDGTAQTRTLGQSAFPLEASEELRRQRKLNMLRGRLKSAVAAEEYETAARLRDEISHMENEVLVP